MPLYPRSQDPQLKMVIIQEVLFRFPRLSIKENNWFGVPLLCNLKLSFRFHGSGISDVTVAMHETFCCLLDRVERTTSSNVYR